MTHVLVVGGGVTGVAAAQRLRERGGPQLRVTLVEQSRRLGGKIRTGELAGVPLETGAESFLVRRPEGVDLAAAVGLSDEVVYPATTPSGLVLHDGVHDLPRRTVMGVPAEPADVADVVSQAGLERMAREKPESDVLCPHGEDVAVGALVRDRFGDEIVDRLVDPLLGGVYSGRADDLSLAATVPALAAAAASHSTLRDAVRACLPDPGVSAATPKPVFGTVSGGLSRLVDTAADAAGAEIKLGLAVRELRRTEHGWQAVLGSAAQSQQLHADAVVLAIPARPAARLLTEVAPAASADIGRLDYASVALVSLALPDAQLPQRSGLLAPAAQGRGMKAATFFSRKWPHVESGRLSMVRVSVGRYGQEHLLQRDDADLIDMAVRELSEVTRTRLPAPQAATVHRWGGALPQYAPGHLDRVRRARAELRRHPIALAGAAFDGVGVCACIASGQAAANALLAAA